MLRSLFFGVVSLIACASSATATPIVYHFTGSTTAGVGFWGQFGFDTATVTHNIFNEYTIGSVDFYASDGHVDEVGTSGPVFPNVLGKYDLGSIDGDVSRFVFNAGALFIDQEVENDYFPGGRLGCGAVGIAPDGYGGTLATQAFATTPGALLITPVCSGGTAHFSLTDVNYLRVGSFEGTMTSFAAGPTPVPEPLSLALASTGLSIIALRRRRKR
jgi:hypothetical protein